MTLTEQPLSRLAPGQAVARYAPGGRLLAMIVGGPMRVALQRPIDRGRLFASQELLQQLGNVSTEEALKWAADTAPAK